MKSPEAGWVLFNLFRLTAVSFLFLALVAQFIALASDLKAQSEAKHPLSNSTSILHSNDTSSRTQLTGSTRPSITISSPSSSFSSSSRTIDPLPPVVITVSTASASTSRSPGRDAPLISNIEDDVEDENGDLVSVTRPTSLLTATRAAQGPQTDVLVVPARRQLSRRAGKEVEGEPVNGTYGLSSIPTSSGGIMFAAMSRVLIVSALCFLILAQLGIPEMWLYRNTPIFGPQSTPLWLGVAQVVVAIENLRVYSVTIVWTAHVVLLAVGMINAHLALILIFLARRRKLPKNPPPPLYFSHMTRLLFFRPDPPCYLQLLANHEGENEIGMKPAPGRARGLQVTLGESESGGPAAPPPFAGRNDPSTDVRQGGYPTFARGGLGAPGSQVPAGVIDSGTDGRVRGFTSRPPRDTRSVETGDAYSGVADDESRADLDATALAERNASISSVGSQRSTKSKRKPAPLIGIEHSSAGTSGRPVEVKKDERQMDIDKLREKLGGKVERKASTNIQRTVIKGRGAARPVIGNPVLQRSTSDRHNGPRMLNVGPAATPRTGVTVLPGIPKRSNTLDQGSARTPNPQVTLSPPTAKSVRQPNPSSIRPAEAPALPPKSPAKSLAGSLYSSILPWTKSSKSGSPNKPDQDPQLLVPVVRPDQKRQNPPLARSVTVQHKPRPNRIDELAGATGSSSGVPAPRATSPLSRSDSASKLQKKTKDTRSPSPLPPVYTRQQSPELQRSDADAQASHRDPASTGGAARGALGTSLDSDSPLTTMIESVKAKTHGIPELSPTPEIKSPSPPSSPPIRPMTTQSMYPNSSLRSSLAQLQRADSTRSAKSARTAMGVRFDLEKRHSLSDEDLMSPEGASTATPRSAGFRIPGTKLTIPFPSTSRKRISQGSSAASTPTEQRSRGDSGLILDINNDDYDNASFMSSEIEAARPESVASLSSAGSVYHRRALDDLNGVKRENSLNRPCIRRISERAGLPKRSNRVVHDVDKQARRSHAVVLGGTYLDGGEEGANLGHRRRPSSTGSVVKL